MKTSERLVDAAAALLDAGGEPAVTLRAVGKAAGVSQNAAYRHFEDRSALLAAVAIQNARALTRVFAEARQIDALPLERLRRALEVFVEFGQTYPARHHLLFSDPGIAAQDGELREAATASFAAFTALVEDCQRSGNLPSGPPTPIAGLIMATTHGLLDFQNGGRLRVEKGFTSVMASVDLLLGALSGR